MPPERQRDERSLATRLGLRKRLLAHGDRLLQAAGRRSRFLQLLVQPRAGGALLLESPLDARRGVVRGLGGPVRAVERRGCLGAAAAAGGGGSI